MKLVRFLHNNVSHIGILENDKVIKLNVKDDMNEFIQNDEIKNVCDKKLDSINIKDAKILSPIKAPLQDIICLGINYLAHAEESAKFKKEEFAKRDEAVYFGKRVNECTNPGDVIYLDSNITAQFDYEVELALIIKKDCRNVSAKDAKDYIFGYSIGNDISARDVQLKHKQWYAGKSLEGAFPFGPCIVTDLNADNLSIKSYVNDELRQNSNTKDLIFDINYIIEELSKYFTIKAGSIIITGTPSGVGMGFNPPKFLKNGDIVRCEIEGIGYLENKIVAK